MPSFFAWFPRKPPINVDANDFSFKQWFQSVYRFMVGETHAALSQTAALTPAEQFLYPVDASGGAVVVTLPLAQNYAYKKYMIKKTDASANTVTIQRDGTDTIDGSTSVVLTNQYDWLEVYSNGAFIWFKLSDQVGGGGGGGSITSIDADAPITVTPDPITSTGTISHDNTAVTPGTYGDATNVSQITVNAKGHITDAVEVAISAVGSIAGWVSITIAAGGGGGATSSAAAAPGPGGGSGESIQNFIVKMTPGASVSYAVGAGGATDTDGGDTTFGAFTAKGGKKGNTGGNSGAGGGAGGGGGAAAGASGTLGTAESATYFGGGAGGGRATGTTTNGGPGSGSGGYDIGGAGGIAGGSQGGGGGGAASVYGIGGAGGAGGAVGSAAASTAYGAGGGGGGGFSTGKAGGAGAGGYILIAYLGGAIEFTSGSGSWTVPSP